MVERKQCPRCGEFSGDDWSQCAGGPCPMRAQTLSKGEQAVASTRVSSASLGEAAVAIAHLAHAVRLALYPLMAEVDCRWCPDRGLYVRVLHRAGQQQRVLDALQHGALHGAYDYRFRNFTYSTGGSRQGGDWIETLAWPDLQHDQRQVEAHRQVAAELLSGKN